MFNLEDSTYKKMPKNLSIETSLVLIDRIAEYMRLNSLKEFKLVLHGGEPILWPMENFHALFHKIEKVNNTGLRIRVSLQTNLYKLNWEALDLLYNNKVTIGVSIDGTKEQHDKFRLTHNNKPTYDKIMSNLEKIMNSKYARMIGGFLTVADPETSADEYFQWVTELPVTSVSVLWPIAYNYRNTPWSHLGISEEEYIQSPHYGKWFSDLFQIWWKNDNPKIYIRLFYETIGALMGSKRHGDSLVNDCLDMVVVNTDGAVEYHDYFRAFKDSAIETGYSILRNTLSEVESDRVVQLLLNLGKHLPLACSGCDHKDICGGGFLAGRMETHVSDFTINNSILCYDYYYYIETVKRFVTNSKVTYRDPQLAAV
jgi:uncharacterized protein